MIRNRNEGLIRQKAGLIRTFQQFLRRKITDANSTNWRHDPEPDRTVLLEREKNPCFDAHDLRYFPSGTDGNCAATVVKSSGIGCLNCAGGRVSYVTSHYELRGEG